MLDCPHPDTAKKITVKNKNNLIKPWHFALTLARPTNIPVNGIIGGCSK
jgi:hypothetical protein